MAGVFASQTTFGRNRESIVGSFKLEHNAVAVIGVCNSLFFAGVASGVLFSGKLSDAFGRRAAVLASSATISTGSFLSAFARSPGVFSLFRLLTGVGVGLGGANCYVLATEFVPPRHRSTAAAGMSAFCSIGMLFIAPLAFCLGSWRHLMIVVSLLNLYPLLLRNQILESPRWLLAKGREAEAKEVLLKVGRSRAGRGGAPVHAHSLELRAAPGTTAASMNEGLLDGLRKPALRLRLAVMACCWFVTGLVYYGLACNVGAIPGSVHVNQSLFALADLAAIPLQLLLFSRLGRRPALLLASSATALGLLSSVHAEAFPLLSLLPSRMRLLLAKSAITVQFTMIYLYGTELFPTSLRASAMALCSLSARVASVLAPLLLSAVHTNSRTSPLGASSPPTRLSSSASSSPADLALYSLFAGGVISAAAAVRLLLPETKGLALPETLADVSSVKRKGKRRVEDMI